MSFHTLSRCCALLLLIPLGTSFAGQWSPEQIREILADRIDNQGKSVGITVGLIDEQGSSVVGYGRLSESDTRQPDGQTVFEIGSITKVFTSVLLADMVQSGKLELADPVQGFLPDTVRVPSKNDTTMTLYHLSTHTSGLPRMPDNFNPADPGNPFADYTVGQMYEFLNAVELSDTPGAKAAYSNYGTGLLGHILALQSGTDYETLVKQCIAGPLDMQDTVITLTPELKSRLARGHDVALQPVANWDIPTLAGAGALRSTVDDMLLFLAANLGLTESELSPALKETHRPREEFGRPNRHIGLGWLIREGHGRSIHWHNGGTGGYHSFAAFDKESKTGVVVLSNSPNDIDDIGFHLLEPEYELAAAPAGLEFNPEDFDEYVGHYQLTPEFIISVTRNGNRFFIQATGQGPLEVFPESPTRFKAQVVEAAVSFSRGEDGKIRHMTLHQGGRHQKARRIDGKEAAVPDTVAVPEETLQKYVGQYELQPQFVLTIRRDGSRLFAQATGQPENEIFAESQTKFFLKVVDAQISFNASAAGDIESLTLHQAGRNMPARRMED